VVPDRVVFFGVCIEDIRILVRETR
jgi:hypothetical protein